MKGGEAGWVEPSGLGPRAWGGNDAPEGRALERKVSSGAVFASRCLLGLKESESNLDPLVPSPGPWARTPSLVMPASSVLPTSRS